MKRAIVLLSLICLSVCASAKDRKTAPAATDPALVYSNSFETPAHNPDTSVFNTHSLRYRFPSVLSEGISGKALDLTDDTPVRVPVILTEEETPDYSKNFSFSVWVQTKKDARQGTAVMGSKKNYDFLPLAHDEHRHLIDDPLENEWEKPGWLVGTTDSGAWYFYISDGNKQYNYYPTAERQRINDGEWHHIAGSVNLEDKELWLYFDGKNVTVYNIEEIEAPVNDWKTAIGGTYEYRETEFFDSRSEWTAFNGKVDEVKLWNRSITPEDVRNEYIRYRPDNDPFACLEETAPHSIKVQSWNIWHGGHRYGEYVGVQRVIDVLKSEKADIIGLVETYGSGAMLADALGYYFYLISDNLSILSRFPIDSVVKFYKAFRSGGAVLNVSRNNKLLVLDIWLDWRGSAYHKLDVAELVKSMPAIAGKADEIPIISVGDYNSRSFRDYDTDYPNFDTMFYEDCPSRFMAGMGFRDSYREMWPDYHMHPGYTWAEVLNNSTPVKQRELARVDYIYYKGKALEAYYSNVINHHPVFWPADHSSVITYFYLNY